MMKLIARCMIIFVLALLSACASIQSKKVTLKSGETYEVKTVRGLPIQFANDQIKVRDLGITAVLTRDKVDPTPFVWVLSAELTETGSFVVTVTTPLDKSASTTFAVAGPGNIAQRFFPQANYPLIWEGIDQPGIHWFPFHFTFEEKQSKKRFDFMQWAQMDSETMKQLRGVLNKIH